MSAMTQMLRIGRGAALTAEAGRIRTWLLAVAAFLLAAGLGVLVLAQSSFDGRAQRSQERAIDWVPGARDAKLIAQPVTDMVGTTTFQVVWLVPLRADAPLPPGLDRWPKPGEAVLSPALAEAGAGTAERIDNRYGKSVGLIGAEGLQAPAELLAYARPAGVRTTSTPSRSRRRVSVGPTRLLSARTPICRPPNSSTAPWQVWCSCP